MGGPEIRAQTLHLVVPFMWKKKVEWDLSLDQCIVPRLQQGSLGVVIFQPNDAGLKTTKCS